MYKITINNVTQIHEFEELIKVFLRPEEFKIVNNGTIIDNLKTLSAQENTTIDKNSGLSSDIEIIVPEELTLNYSGSGGRNAIKQFLFNALSIHLDLKPEWGIHTGVRPVKLLFELIEKEGSLQKAENVLSDYYLFSNEKINLLKSIYKLQSHVCDKSKENAKGVYVGIPFCPTRCEYCSFPSNQVSEQEADRYLTALLKEIRFVAAEMKKKGWYPETIYIGGGTPTALTNAQLNTLLKNINDLFKIAELTEKKLLREFTLEAGRPDTIDEQKLAIAKACGVNRISINPQSMKEETLKLIGRKHSGNDIINAFTIAKKSGIGIINADLIAGLPEENPEDFVTSLKDIVSLEAENITIHTLALKRASLLKKRDENYHRSQGMKVKEMLRFAEEFLFNAGYEPYYLYRQKQMAGNFENVGYCKPSTENLYNIRIMEEAQTIIAMGAGGISKVYYPDENRLERVPNVSNYEIYIERIDEMLERKEKGIFRES